MIVYWKEKNKIAIITLSNNDKIMVSFTDNKKFVMKGISNVMTADYKLKPQDALDLLKLIKSVQESIEQNIEDDNNGIFNKFFNLFRRK